MEDDINKVGRKFAKNIEGSGICEKKGGWKRMAESESEIKIEKDGSFAKKENTCSRE